LQENRLSYKSSKISNKYLKIAIIKTFLSLMFILHRYNMWNKYTYINMLYQMACCSIFILIFLRVSV